MNNPNPFEKKGFNTRTANLIEMYFTTMLSELGYVDSETWDESEIKELVHKRSCEVADLISSRNVIIQKSIFYYTLNSLEKNRDLYSEMSIKSEDTDTKWLTGQQSKAFELCINILNSMK